MPTLDDVRAIALSFPETIEKVDGHRGGAGWRTPDGVFVWERGPSKADVAALAALGRTWPDGPVVGVRTDGLEGKEALLGTFPEVVLHDPALRRVPGGARASRRDRARPAARGDHRRLDPQGTQAAVEGVAREHDDDAARSDCGVALVRREHSGSPRAGDASASRVQS